jgi:hypothetical protein
MYIYYLHINNIPFYIGKCVDPIRRKSKHKISFGIDVSLEIIEKIDEKEWKYWECFWIEVFKQWGFNLVNKNRGGGGPTKWSEEQKQKINPVRIQKIKDNKERGIKISNSLKQRNHSQYYTPEVKNKMSLSQIGKSKIFSEKHLKNLADAIIKSRGKTVECYSLDDNYITCFPCLREAKIWLNSLTGVNSINVDKQIKDCCLGRQKTCHGYKWKYKT